MKLISLSLAGYRQFLERSEVQFTQGMTGICGPNGVGKSKLIEAIGFALYGPRSQILPAGDKSEYIRSFTTDEAQTLVVLTIEIKAERYVITRTLTKAEIRIAGAPEVLARTPKGVTAFVTRLLRLSAEAFVGTFVARQNEVAKLHSLDKKPRIDLIHRLIGISQLQVAIELAEKALDDQKQGLRQAESALLVDSHVIATEIVSVEEAMGWVVAEEQKTVLALAACTKELQQKQATLERLIREQEQKASKKRELELQQESFQQATIRQGNIHLDWEYAHAAANRQGVINTELAALTDAEAQFEHWNAMSAREVLLQQRQSLRDQLFNELKPAHEALLRTEAERQVVSQEIEPVLVELAASSTRKTVAIHCKARAQEAVASFEDKRNRMSEIGPGGICDNCGMIFGSNSYQTALEACNQEVLKHGKEIDYAAQEELKWERQIRVLKQQHAALQAKESSIVRRLADLADVPGQVKAIECQIVNCDKQLAALRLEDSDGPFSLSAYNIAKEELDRKIALVSEMSSITVLASQEGKFKSELEEVQNWLHQLGFKIQVLEDSLLCLTADDVSVQVTDDALQEIKEKHRQLSEKERHALEYRIRQETQLEERRQQLERVKAQEANLNLLRQNLLTAERTLTLLRQMLTEINEEARPRLAELMDTWLRSLIGEKFTGVTLSEDYRVMADCGAGFRALDHFSGGEQTLLAVMLRVAISLFCQERAGFDTSFLILDEVFGNQDVMHRNQLASFLMEIQEHYHQILIVNHVEDVTQMLDTIIEVIPTGLNTSRLKSPVGKG